MSTNELLQPKFPMNYRTLSVRFILPVKWMRHICSRVCFGLLFHSSNNDDSDFTLCYLLFSIEQLKLLTKLEKAGLLSAVEKSGLTLSKIEKLGLLSTAENLGLLSAASDR